MNPDVGEIFHTGPEAYPASCKVGTGSFLGLKLPGRDVDHPHLCSAEVKERVELLLFSPSGPSWPVLGRTLIIIMMMIIMIIIVIIIIIIVILSQEYMYKYPA